MNEIIKKEIKGITKKDVEVIGPILNNDFEKIVIGHWGSVRVSKMLMRELNILENWQKATIYGNVPFFSLFIDIHTNDIKLKIVVENHTFAPIEDYVNQEIVDMLYAKIKEYID